MVPMMIPVTLRIFKSILLIKKWFYEFEAYLKCTLNRQFNKQANARINFVIDDYLKMIYYSVTLNLAVINHSW